MQAVDLSQSAASARTAADQALANDEALPPEPEAVQFAFIIYMKSDGQLVLTNDINVAVVPERAPTHDEVYGAFQIMTKDMLIQQQAATSAQAVLQMQQALMQQIQGSGEFEKIRQTLQQERRG